MNWTGGGPGQELLQELLEAGLERAAAESSCGRPAWTHSKAGLAANRWWAGHRIGLINKGAQPV